MRSLSYLLPRKQDSERPFFRVIEPSYLMNILFLLLLLLVFFCFFVFQNPFPTERNKQKLQTKIAVSMRK